MIGSNHRIVQVRERQARYRPGGGEEERFPGELALDDLRTVPEDEVPLVLARYAAIRFRLLAGIPAPPPLLDHAGAAAAAQLRTTPEHWPERVLLWELLEPAPRVAPQVVAEKEAELLEAVGRAAEGWGHRHGAYAARHAAWTLSLCRLRLATAARVARGIAQGLRREGQAAAAGEWDRVAGRLERCGAGWEPPSVS
jgi:hypothetical protein